MNRRPSRSASRPPTPRTAERPGVRLNKFLAAAGITSRRKADELIREGVVKVNGRVVESLGVKIDPATDQVFVKGKQAVILDEPVYILFNKPNDCITTASDERGRTTVFDYVKFKRRIFPVGRLDRKTTGVLLLTNDGEFAQRLMHPRTEVKKSYQLTLDKPLLPQDAQKLAAGVQLADGMTEPAEVFAVPGGKNKVVGMVIHEGKNRQIHRMIESLGYAVEKLDRVGYAGISCEGLKRGEWRFLTKAERKRLATAAGIEEPG
jgi:pseudouridine synthase